MKIFQVIHNSSMAWEYDDHNVIFSSDDLDLAIDFAKKSLKTHVLNQSKFNFDWSFHSYNQFAMANILPFDSNQTCFEDNSIYIIEIELNKPASKRKNVVWNVDENTVFALFSENLDEIFYNSTIPVLSVEEKQEIFNKFKINRDILSSKSKLYFKPNLVAADIVAMTAANQNDLAIYEDFEAKFH